MLLSFQPSWCRILFINSMNGAPSRILIAHHCVRQLAFFEAGLPGVILSHVLDFHPWNYTNITFLSFPNPTYVYIYIYMFWFNWLECLLDLTCMIPISPWFKDEFREARSRPRPDPRVGLGWVGWVCRVSGIGYYVFKEKHNNEIWRSNLWMVGALLI